MRVATALMCVTLFVGCATAPDTAVEPINAVCPLTGEPAEGDATVMFAGREIAFCCSRCAKKFESLHPAAQAEAIAELTKS